MGGVICVREGDGGVISIGYFGIGAITVLPAIDKGEEEVGGDEETNPLGDVRDIIELVNPPINGGATAGIFKLDGKNKGCRFVSVGRLVSVPAKMDRW